MKKEISLETIIEAMPKPIISRSTPPHHRSKEKGSILDQYRSEIFLLLKHRYSYGEIVYWLKNKKNISTSKTALHNRIQYWKKWQIYG
ncbi:hypothetical protein [Vibrio paucivorans]|uniref:Uncharacterized protein n=1 Tax=Vibrio paucivorans TaxID=2829489 RepID=A0A9X3CIJ1_9VIBR|nr:hypothetical protein [Vibrio paucivorans]MCW8336315.1 hypothetical protein [Vibrio paucivorans]